MEKIFFVYGSSYHAWREHRRDDYHSFSTKGVIEIGSTTVPGALEKAQEVILEAINQGRVGNKIISEGRPHEAKSSQIGGSWTQFHAQFFSDDLSKKEFIEELNIGLEKVLEKVFEPNNK